VGLILGLCSVPCGSIKRRPMSQKIREREFQGNYFELIPTVKMETRVNEEGSFGNKFPSIYNHCGVMAA